MRTTSDFGWLLQRLGSSRWRIALGLLCVSFAGLAATADPLFLQLRIELLDQMNRPSEDYHQQTPTGEKLTRMEHDVDAIADLGADTANQSIRAILFFVLYLVMMVRLNLSMTQGLAAYREASVSAWLSLVLC
jgi:ABC-type multidrug transport system fused ATPase/permease subunit